jgi:hypothetical protein
MLETGLEEVLGGVKPPDLVAKVQGQLEGIPREARDPVHREHPLGGTVPTARRGFFHGYWPWLSVAAAAGALLWAMGTMGSAGNVPRVDLEIWVLRGEVTWSGDGETRRGEASERISVPLGEGDRLHSGVTVPTALQLPQFGTLYTEPNTILEIQSMDIRHRKGAITIGAVTLVVLTGAVTWNALAQSEEAVTGETLRLEAQAPGVGITAREQELLDANEVLEQRLAALESQAARNRLEVEEVVDPLAADVVAGEEPDLEARFVDDKYGAALAGVDWKVVGTALKGMVPVSAQLAEAILADGDAIPLELAGEMQQFNGQLLAQLQPLMDGEVPGTGPNGTFTHPLVVANQVDQVLAAGDVPLSQDQSERLSAITNHYLAQDENLRVSAEGYELSLETLLQETAMKAQFREEIEQILSTEQHEMLYPEAVQDYNGLDLFGTGLIWSQFAKPMRVDGPQGAAGRLMSSFTSGLELGEDQQERLRPLLDNWSRSYPEEYWSDKANALEGRGMLKTSRTRIAAERQLVLFKAILASGTLTPEQREKFVNNNGVFVPLVR